MPTLLWTVGCGAELRRRLLWRGVPAGSDVAYSSMACTRLPDGTPIAVCCEIDGWLEVWDLATGQQKGRLTDPQMPPRQSPQVACTQLPDGTPVAVTAGNDGVVRVWDLLSGQIRGRAQTDRVWAMALADGAGIAMTSSPGGVIRFWDVATADLHGQVTCDDPLPVVAADDSVVVIGDGSALRVWDLQTGQLRGTPLKSDFDVNRLACLRLVDGTALAVTGSDRQRDDTQSRRFGTVQAWNLTSGRCYGPPLTGHGGEINGLAAIQLPDGTPVAVSVDRYGAVRAWNLATGQAHGPALPRLGRGETPNVACTHLPDGTPVVVTANEDVQVWSLLVEPSPHALSGPIWTVGCTELPDGDEVVVTVGQEHRRGYTVQLWDASTGRLRGRLLAGQADKVVACARAAVLTTEGRIVDCIRLGDGTELVITGAPVRAWELDTGRPYGPTLPDGRVRSFPQLPMVFLFDNHGNVRTWDLRTGQPYGTWQAGPGYDAVAGGLLPDGTPVAVVCEAAVMRVWDLATGRPRGQPMQLRTSQANALTCTAVAAVGGDSVVEVWDLANTSKRHDITLPSPCLDLRFTGQHHLIVRTHLDIAVYDLSRDGDVEVVGG
jgi:WD40 repeat protein